MRRGWATGSPSPPMTHENVDSAVRSDLQHCPVAPSLKDAGFAALVAPSVTSYTSPAAPALASTRLRKTLHPKNRQQSATAKTARNKRAAHLCFSCPASPRGIHRRLRKRTARRPPPACAPPSTPTRTSTWPTAPCTSRTKKSVCHNDGSRANTSASTQAGKGRGSPPVRHYRHNGFLHRPHHGPKQPRHRAFQNQCGSPRRHGCRQNHL